MASGATRLIITDVGPEWAELIEAFAREVAAHDGHEAFGEQTIFNLTSADVSHYLVIEDGEVAGYAQTDRHSAELAVHPSARRRGIGAALLTAVKTDDPTAAVWAHGNLPAAQALAKRSGLKATRELLYMTAPLTPRQIPSAPAGVTVATYTDDDAEDWLAVNAAAFADHPEQGRLTIADLNERTRQPWFDANNFWLARDDGGELLAYMWVKREPDSTMAEIYVLGVSPAAQGRGLGRYLTELSLAHMSDAGVTTMDLYVEGDNHPALATYRAFGFTPAITHVQYT